MACVLYQAVTEGSGESPRLGCDGDLYTGTQEAGVSSTLRILLSLHPPSMSSCPCTQVCEGGRLGGFWAQLPMQSLSAGS